ncbi:MAG: CusA/CzcA family heavy metal efflux RND transporter [Bacteroidales bacterium]
MIQSIIRFSVKNKFIIGIVIMGWIGWGIYSFMNLPLNTVPDLTNNQVKVTTYAPDLATEEVEQLITYPIELEMGNLPGLKEIRSVSKFGLSDITLVFEDDMGTYKPRQLVKEHLEVASGKLPEGVGKPKIGPITTGLGEVYQYVLSTRPGYDTVYSAMNLRTIQDWVVKKEMINIDGVVGVNTMGGYLKQYEVAVDPEQLRSFDLAISDLYTALKRNNANTGGSYIEKNRKAYFIRGQGQVRSLDEIRDIKIRTVNGQPLQIGDIAGVQYGNATRFGAFTYNGKGEAVGGKVMMLRGENPAEVIANVKERLPRVREALPEGVEIVPFLDRSTLIGQTTSTVAENLLLGALIVIFILVLLMGNMRSGLIVASVIPLSLLFALGILYTFDISANLISLGAVDFGIIIDGAVIIVEFMVFQMSRKLPYLRSLKGRKLRHELDNLAISSSGRMMRTAFFGQLIILIVFIPILTLTDQEGDMFRPMAITFGAALIGAILLCLTYVPMISALILRPEKSDKPRLADRILRSIREGYRNILRLALRFRYATVTFVLILLTVALLLFTRMGAVFIPTLDEGDFAIHPFLQPGTSLTETVEINTRLEKILLGEFPDEVEQVATKIGTGEIPTDPMSLEMSKMIINLSPKEEWTRAETKEELERLMKQEMSVIPGVNFFFSQPIEMLFNHLLTGSSADVLLNIYGTDLDTLFAKGNRAKTLISELPGAGDINVQKVIGLPQIVVDYDRDKLAQYGLEIDQLNQTIQSSFSGAKTGTVYEGERRFDLVVRLKEEYRNDPETLRDLYLVRSNDRQIRLGDVAEIYRQTGPAEISREGVKRKLEVGVNIGNRDMESFVREVQRKMEHELDLPGGYYIDYEGDFKSLQRAKNRLSWVVPLVLGFIFALLYFTFNSFRQAMLVFSAVPLAAIGGIFALWIRGMPFSISAGVGFIALFGIAVLNGVVLMSFFNELKTGGMGNVFKRVYHGTDMRLRPVILTALTDALGFLPMALSTSAGAEVQRPLATVVVGGLITATILTLILLPVIYTFSERRPHIPGLDEILTRARKRINGFSGKGLLLMALLATPLAGAFGQEAGEHLIIQSPEEAVEMALENHPAVKQADLNVSQQQELGKTAIDLPDATVSYEKENEGEGITRWAVKQGFEFPLQYVAMAEFSSKKIAQSKRERDLVIHQLKKEVRKAYYNVLYTRGKLRLLTEIDTIFNRLREAADLKYQTGDTPYLEKVSASAKYKGIQVEMEQAQAELENERRELKKLLYVDRLPEIDEDRLTELEFEGAELLKDTLSGNPEIRIAEGRWLEEKARTKVIKSRSWPDPFIRASRITLPGSSNFGGFEVGLSFPLDVWAEKGRNQAAEIAGMEENQAFLNVQNNMLTKNRQQQKKLSVYREQLRFYQEERLEEAETIMQSAEQQYQQGNIGYIEYIRYFDQAMRIRMDYLKKLNRYNQAVIELKYIQGN